MIKSVFWKLTIRQKSRNVPIHSFILLIFITQLFPSFIRTNLHKTIVDKSKLGFMNTQSSTLSNKTTVCWKALRLRKSDLAKLLNLHHHHLKDFFEYYYLWDCHETQIHLRSLRLRSDLGKKTEAATFSGCCWPRHPHRKSTLRPIWA